MWINRNNLAVRCLVAAVALNVICMLAYTAVKYRAWFAPELPYKCTQRSFSDTLRQCEMTESNATQGVAFVTQLYTPEYFEAVLTMAHSLRQFHPQVTVIIMYFPERIAPSFVAKFQRLNYTMLAVKRVSLSSDRMSPFLSFADQYTKLRVFQLTEYERLIYLDADTLVLGKLDALMKLPRQVQFAAVGDVWYDRSPFESAFDEQFNAGVLSLVPCEHIFEHLLHVANQCPASLYPKYFAEQALMNYFFDKQYVHMDYKYQINYVMVQDKMFHPELAVAWQRLKKDARIVHFTLFKPFRQLEPPEKAFEPLWKAWNKAHRAAHAELDAATPQTT